MIPVVVGSNPIGHPNLAPPRKWRRPALAELATPSKAFCAIFSAALAQVGANARGVVEGRDPEYLHQMRVGLRRLRSALRAFRDLVPRRAATPVATRSRALMRALGATRDWDVFCDGVARIGTHAPERAPGMGRLLARARSRRGAAGRRAREAAAPRALQAFLFRALRWLHAEPWKRRLEHPALGEFAAHSLERLHRKALHKARDMDWHDAGRRHRMRIGMKRLRYACDFFAPSFAGASTRLYIKRLEALQDILGDLNDIAVAHRLLDDLAPRGSARGIAAGAAYARRTLGVRQRILVMSLEPAWTAFEKRRPFWRPRG